MNLKFKAPMKTILMDRRLLPGILFLLILGISFIYFIRFMCRPNFGLIDNYPEVLYHEQQLIFSPRALFSPAVKAGLLSGRDIIVSIDGQEIRNTRDFVRIVYGLKSFRAVPVSVIRDGKSRVDLEIVPSMALMRPDWIFFLLFALSLIFTAFCLFRYAPQHKANWFMGMACLVYLPLVCVKPFFYESIFSLFLVQAGSFAPWLLVFYCLYYPSAKGKTWLRNTFVFVICFLFLFYSISRLYSIGNWFSGGEEEWLLAFRKLGRMNNIANAVAYLFFIVLLLHSYYANQNVIIRNQFRWTIIGFIFAISVYYCLEELPLLIGEHPGLRFGTGYLSFLFLIPIPVFFLMGLLGNKKIHYRTVRTGLLVHLLLIVFVFYFFFVLYSPLVNYLQGNNGFPAEIAGLVSFLLLFLLLFPLFFICHKLVTKIFYRKKYSKSAEYIEELEEDNAYLKYQWAREKQERLAEARNWLSHDHKLFCKGINAWITKSIRRHKTMIENLASLRIPAGVEHNLIQQGIGELKEEYLLLSDLRDQLKSGFVTTSFLEGKIPVQDLISRAVTEVRHKYADLSLQFEPDFEAAWQCNSGEISLALTNILENGYEAFPGSVLELHLRIDRQIGEGIISIRDNGNGIPATLSRRIYEPFFSTKPGHLGLGLYQAKLNIEKNHGRIQCRNLSTAGTLVTIIFPLVKSA